MLKGDTASLFEVVWLWFGLVIACYACWYCLRVGQHLRGVTVVRSEEAEADALEALLKMLWGVSAAMVYLLVSGLLLWLGLR